MAQNGHQASGSNNGHGGNTYLHDDFDSGGTCVWFYIDINILLCDDIVCWKIVCSVGANFVVLALAKLPTGRPPHIPETVSHKSMLEYSTAKDS